IISPEQSKPTVGSCPPCTYGVPSTDKATAKARDATPSLTGACLGVPRMLHPASASARTIASNQRLNEITPVLRRSAARDPHSRFGRLPLLHLPRPADPIQSLS